MSDELERGTLVRILDGLFAGQTWEVAVDNGAFVSLARGVGDEGTRLNIERSRLEVLF